MTRAEPAASKLDRFGLQPPRRGTLRGVVRNIRIREEEASVGRLEIVDFDLHVSDAEPPVPVQLRGNDFSRPLFADSVADVADPDPSIRPLQTRRVVFPHNPNNDFISYYPGVDDLNTSKDRFWSVVALAVPVITAIALAILIYWYFFARLH